MNAPVIPLSRDLLLNLGTRPLLEEVPLPAPASGTVWVRALSQDEKDQFEESLRVRNGDDVSVDLVGVRSKLVTLTACDIKGNRLFKDEDLAAVGQIPAKVLEPAFEAAQRLAGFKKDEVERLVKKSEPTPDAASVTPSPDTSAAPSAS